jgi:hypothetical protein
MVIQDPAAGDVMHGISGDRCSRKRRILKWQAKFVRLT